MSQKDEFNIFTDIRWKRVVVGKSESQLDRMYRGSAMLTRCSRRR